jgi:hypothetical protein
VYLSAGISALAMAAFSAWCASRWAPAIIPAVLLVFSSALALFLAFRPTLVLTADSLRIGRRLIPWSDIRALDRTGWISPLLVHITLADSSRILLIYPGDIDSTNSLLRGLRRSAREARIDGVPYSQFWGEPARPDAAPRYQVLLPEDEAEVERLFQRLKTVGHLDPKKSPDEH